MRARPILALAAVMVVLTGCTGEHRASQEARDLARERALDVGNELAAGVFVNGPDGVNSGLERAYVGDRADIATSEDSAMVKLWFTETVFIEGSGFGWDIEESAVICVEYTVELVGGDTVIREDECPESLPSGEHVAEASLGDDVSIDAHDAMRALNRFPHGADDRYNKYTETKQAREKLPDAIEALRPVSEQEVVSLSDIEDALAEVELDVTDSLARDRGIEFGAGIGGGCVFGTVGPGVLEVEAGGYLADGQGCIDTGQ